MAKAKKKAAAEQSKKNAQKKKDRIIDDKTFGLKNKNKSKKVQAHIQSVTSNVMNSGCPRQRKLDEQRKRAKVEQKARKKAAEDERNALFGEALLAVKKKGSTKMKGENDAKGRDHDEKKEKSGTSRAMKMMFQMDAKEMEDALKADPNYVPTLEDEIEFQRQEKLKQLAEKGEKGTPITPETFAAWQAKKRKRKQDEAKKLVEAELKKKKGGKGLSVLSGRALFEYKQDLFKDSTEGAVIDHGNMKEEKEGEDEAINDVAEKVQSDLFLDGDDDDLDDLDDLDDE